MAAGDENKTIFARVQGGWNSLESSQRFALAAAFVFLLVVGAAFSLHFGRAQYRVLFRGMQPGEGAAVIDYLVQIGVSYRIEEGGTAILVPKDELYELRFRLAGETADLVQGRGFAIFDNARLGISDFERQVKYQWALQEELQRTIASLDSVNQARVHLALPEPTVFLRETVAPSAAVYLRLNPFVSLEEEQVSGIVNLVVGSVEGLERKNVTVVDSAGAILYDFMQDDQVMLLSEKLQDQFMATRNLEETMERQLVAMLQQVFGPGRAMATVSLDLDFDTLERTTLRYDLHEPVTRSQQVTEVIREGEQQPLMEVGDPNYPGYYGVMPADETRYERREEVTNYELGETVERQIIVPGSISRLSVAVLIDDDNLTAADTEQVSELVASAVGFDPVRGDSISVQGMTFDTAHIQEMEAMMAEAEAAERQRELIRYAVFGGAALLTFIFLLILLWARRRRKLTAGETADGEAWKEPKLQRALDSIMVEPETSPQDEKREKAKQMAENNPENTVYMLRTWLSEN